MRLGWEEWSRKVFRPVAGGDGGTLLAVTSLYRAAREFWDVPLSLIEFAERAENLTAGRRALWRDRSENAFLRVLHAFQKAGVTEGHLAGTTGYGYDDLGRETLDRIYADLFGAEAALVRMQIVSGTHALSLCLRAAARPGDALVAGTGRPYATLIPQILELRQAGVHYLEVPLGPAGEVDPEALARAVASAAGRVSRTGARVCLFLQRSRGYEPVPSRDVGFLHGLTARARKEAAAAGAELVAVVDNCYGEFVEEREPTAAGADLAGGSLIKNPGGGLAPTGGYVAGRADFVRRAAELLTAPGIGGEGGPTLGLNRLFYQGLFLAPRAVGAALAGVTFAASFFASLGLVVSPAWDEDRTDIIQCVGLGSREAILAFARGIQGAAPVDSRARPVGAGLPGYADEVVMAAGTFVQGASLELSLDAPLRSPYAAYLQGGLHEAHLKVAAVLAATELHRSGLLDVVPGAGPE
jgi:cystathionine beta-lyase family protein involved in aluminum resistance